MPVQRESAFETCFVDERYAALLADALGRWSQVCIRGSRLHALPGRLRPYVRKRRHCPAQLRSGAKVAAT